MLMQRASLALLLVAAAVSPAAAQDTWSWRKAVPAGRASAGGGPGMGDLS